MASKASNRSPLASASQPPSSGDSAARQPLSNRVEQKMAASANLHEAPDIGPNHNYPSPTTSQVPQGSYYRAQPQDRFEAEDDMQMANALSHEMQHDVGTELVHAASLSNGQGHIHDQDLTASPSEAQQSGMAPPPQTPMQQQGPQHIGARNDRDQATGGETSRRKRSKVSRACDSCRRKKVRCDATADDGTVKTCSNCQRVEETCTFSRIPMKRGPSKGYIKELSERVQQVESQMAMSGGPPGGLRSSMDASSPTGLYQDSVFSPDDGMPMSLKRTISLSETRSPFAQPHFMNRDRMPSAGGWSITSGGQGPRSSSGARGSIAIAPDQQYPELPMTTNGQYFDPSKPFWAQDNDLSERPLKRQRTSNEGSGDGPKVEMDAESLAPYFDLIHPFLPFLPKSANDVARQVRNCSSKVQMVFSITLNIACGVKPPSQPTFSSYRDVEEFVWISARESPTLRSDSENLTWLWTYLFMAIAAENDFTRFRSSFSNTLPKDRIIKMAVDLGRWNMKSLKHDASSETLDQTTSMSSLTRRAWNCIGILARLHSISTAADDDIPLAGFDSIGNASDCDLLGTTAAALLARTSNILSLLSTALLDNLVTYTGSLFSLKTVKLVTQHLDLALSTTPPDPSSTLPQQLSDLLSILLVRHTSIQHPVDILTPTLRLVETLNLYPNASPPPTYSPLTVHLFALTSLTLLEFTDFADPDLTSPAHAALKTLYALLSQLSNRTTAAATDIPEPFRSGMHWSTALMQLIDAKMSHSQHTLTTGSAGTDATKGPKDAAVQPQAELQDQQPKVTMIDFALATKYGYLNIVADRMGM